MLPLSEFEAGDVIIKENEMGEVAYFIERGRVEVSKRSDGEKIHLGYIEAGETFGEMSMIDDKPRSATVTAVEKTVAREIHRDRFFESLHAHPKISIRILKVLFERFREAQTKILELQQSASTAQKRHCRDLDETLRQSGPSVFMEGLTPIASASLPNSPFQIRRFPFLIGRKSDDPLSFNDLEIEDAVPYEISRHHIQFIEDKGRVGVSDRGSYLGSIVDGRALGGQDGAPGPLFFEGSEGTLILGNRKSEFRYRIRVP